jgi:hypothetical protein
MTTRVAGLMLSGAALTAAFMLISMPMDGQAPAPGKGKGGGKAAPRAK